MCYRKIPMYSMLISTTPGKLRLPYHNVNRSIAFCSDNNISLPVFGISELDNFNLSAFGLLSCLPTLKEVGYPTSSKANYGRLVYLTRWDSHPLYFTTWHIRTVRHRKLPSDPDDAIRIYEKLKATIDVSCASWQTGFPPQPIKRNVQLSIDSFSECNTTPLSYN